MNTPHNHPAYLWIGEHELLIQKTVAYLQQRLCTHNACRTCTICKKIEQFNHESVLWLSTDKTYTLQMLEPITEIISFMRDAHDPFFFIIQRADLLSAACANSLLKSIEEPPAGYHFIFCAQQRDALLPTIQSRCIIKEFLEKSAPQESSQLFHFFSNNTQYNPATFFEMNEKTVINEQQSLHIINQLLNFWIARYNQMIMHGTAEQIAQCARIVEVARTGLKMAPASGGSKLFWRNFFLQFVSAQ